MFSFAKISVLSVFVLSLFSAGQAAPIIDEISSLSTREISSLEARGILEFFGIHKKLDKADQKLVDTLSIHTQCRLYRIHSKTEKAYKASQKAIAAEESEGTSGATTKGKKDVKAAYEKRIKEFESLAKKAGKKVEEHKKKLEKLGVKDAATHCHHHAKSSSSDAHTESHSAESNAPADSHSESHTVSHS